MGLQPFAPEHLVAAVEQDDADVGSETLTVKHNQTPIFLLGLIIASALCALPMLANPWACLRT
jgi:hypothetical protein